MTETQANELATQITEQFPHVEIVVVQSSDMRNAPHNWFIAVHRKDDRYPYVGIHIHSRLEWTEALDAHYVLSE